MRITNSSAASPLLCAAATALTDKKTFPQSFTSEGRLVAEVRYIALPTMDESLFCYWRRAV
jgi:hypothetical protein